MIRSFSALTLLWLSVLVNAQQVDPATYCTDSLILVHNTEGTLYLQWLVGHQTTLATISATTGLPPSDMRELNPILHFRDIEACDRILIPFHREALTSSATEESYPVFYRVSHGETIFGIAHRVLDVPLDTLLKMNQLENLTLHPWQLLKAGFLHKGYIPPHIDHEHMWAQGWMRVPEYVADSQMVNLSGVKSYARQRGVAWWNKDNRDQNLFALHRSAPLNSLIEIRNPMFGRSVWAKVVGTIPPTYAEDISIIVSPGVAKYLGAIDGRFHVEICYEE